jgi:hypothetical protein
MAVWHPDATRVPYADAGAFEAGFAPRLVWHTTEGSSLPQYSGSAPHFTIDPRDGRLWQHIAVNQAAKALRGSSFAGIATNLAHAIQVEIIGFAGESDNWPDSHYARLRNLAAWIEDECDVASTESVTFESRVHPMSRESWRAYKGHCGHQHIPGQDHWDPGLFKVAKVLSGASTSSTRNLRVGMSGPDVSVLQRAINLRANGCCRPDRTVTVDGTYGEATKDHGAFVGYILGLGENQAELVSGGMSAYVQARIRNPKLRNSEQVERAAGRREQHCRCTR